jgi:LuxR family maltose regulon positive regulatory protein
LFAPAWIFLEPEDNDLVLFVQHLVAAFTDIDPKLGGCLPLLSQEFARQVTTLHNLGLKKPVASNPEDRLIDLLNALAEFSQDIVLILDEYHHIESAEVNQALSFFINYLPQNVHIYLATRSHPPYCPACFRRDDRNWSAELYTSSGKILQ